MDEPGVAVGVGEGGRVGVTGVGVGEKVRVGLAVWVGATVRLGEAVGQGVSVGIGVRVGLLVTVGVGAAGAAQPTSKTATRSQCNLMANLGQGQWHSMSGGNAPIL
jgi:hypothetical protein